MKGFRARNVVEASLAGGNVSIAALAQARTLLAFSAVPIAVIASRREAERGLIAVMREVVAVAVAVAEARQFAVAGIR
jgi:hypothetical protein